LTARRFGIYLCFLENMLFESAKSAAVFSGGRMSARYASGDHDQRAVPPAFLFDHQSSYEIGNRQIVRLILNERRRSAAINNQACGILGGT
jgi:hypothetical protein